MSNLDESIEKASGIEKVRLVLRRAGVALIEDFSRHEKPLPELIDCLTKAYIYVCDSFYNMKFLDIDNPVFKHKEIVELFDGLDKDKERALTIGSRIWGVAVGMAVYKSAKETGLGVDYSAVSNFLYGLPYKDKLKKEIIENSIRTINLFKVDDEAHKLSVKHNDHAFFGQVITSRDLMRIYLSLVDIKNTDDEIEEWFNAGNFVNPSFTIGCWTAISTSYAHLDVSKAVKEIQDESLIK
ncbi:hypothetical protein IKG31_00370 [Candidatus Saccharibacteria bacterium]|nr:hypothetical protein [Candidatus Saccharibacteria bacterium]